MIILIMVPLIHIIINFDNVRIIVLSTAGIQLAIEWDY